MMIDVLNDVAMGWLMVGDGGVVLSHMGVLDVMMDNRGMVIHNSMSVVDIVVSDGARVQNLMGVLDTMMNDRSGDMPMDNIMMSDGIVMVNDMGRSNSRVMNWCSMSVI